MESIKILKHIYLDKCFLFFLVIIILTGNFNYFIPYFSLLLIHELGHAITGIILGYKLDKIVFYPLGGITIFNLPINIPIKKELLILIMGPIMQIFGYVFLIKIYPSVSIYHYTLLLFNLLPIYPLDGGKIVDISSASLAKGTSITVNDFFYNTPVRLKYLRNLNIELASIVDYLHKMALAHPEIKFSLKNDQKLIFKTDGSGDLLKVIYSIYGVDIAKKMIEITNENDDYYINGYISYPEVTRSTRGEITTLVNGRVIKNNKLNKTIIDSYHTYIPKDKFPIIVLNIDVDPYLIDINIHPTKMDIKFSKYDQLEKLISNAIEDQLKKLTLIPTVAVRDKESIEEVRIEKKKEEEQEVINDDKNYEEITFDFEVADEDSTYNEPKMKKMIPRGIVYKTYIIAENEDGMYIIDQHAAAERINYEKVLKGATSDKKIKIDLLVPIKIELPLNEYLIIKDKLSILEDLGFIVDEFGTNTFIIRTHPIWIKEGYEEEDIRKVVDILLENEAFDLERFVYKISATQACRMSIKANDYISYDDQVYLLDTLSKCDNPFTCPHGRPTVIKYTKYELEKLFKRAID